MNEEEISFKNGERYEIKCPICDFNYQHHCSFANIELGYDSYESKSCNGAVRGNVIVVPFRGECGHVWQMCIGFHKGSTYLYAETEKENLYVKHDIFTNISR